MDIAPLMIGATSPDGVSGMEGLIDDVGLFDVALNQSQLQTIMEEGLLKYQFIARLMASGLLLTTNH